MTPLDATTRACPSAAHRSAIIQNTCVADRCMAWRWVATATAADTGDGYCGLAGQPRLTIAQRLADQQGMPAPPPLPDPDPAVSTRTPRNAR